MQVPVLFAFTYVEAGTDGGADLATIKSFLQPARAMWMALGEVGGSPSGAGSSPFQDGAPKQAVKTIDALLKRALASAGTGRAEGDAPLLLDDLHCEIRHPQGLPEFVVFSARGVGPKRIREREEWLANALRPSVASALAGPIQDFEKQFDSRAEAEDDAPLGLLAAMDWENFLCYRSSRDNAALRPEAFERCLADLEAQVLSAEVASAQEASEAPLAAPTRETSAENARNKPSAEKRPKML